MPAIYTIGYEGTDSDRFVAALLAHRVELLADVRAVALSRKKGFSKTALKAALDAAGIDYIHFGDLGDPKPGRLAARAGRMQEFRSIYTAHLEGMAARAALEALAAVAHRKATCLLCFERDPRTCHRSIIAGRLGGRGFSRLDLFVDPALPNDRLTTKLSSLHSRQGVASAEQDVW